MPACSAISLVGVPWNPRSANSSSAMSATSSRRSSALILGPLDRLAAFVFALVFAIVFPRRSKLALTHYLVKGHLRTNVADVEPPSFRRSTQQLRHLLSGVWQGRICCGRP